MVAAVAAAESMLPPQPLVASVEVAAAEEVERMTMRELSCTHTYGEIWEIMLKKIVERSKVRSWADTGSVVLRINRWGTLNVVYLRMLIALKLLACCVCC